MSLRVKTLVMIVIIFLITSSVVCILTQYFLMDSYTKFEKNSTQETINQAEKIVSSDVDNLITINNDWSHWDDAYNFINDRGNAFIEANLNEDTVKNLQLNAIIFLDKNKNIVSKYVHNDSIVNEPTFQNDLKNNLLDKNVFTFVNSKDDKFGFTTLAEQPMVYTISQITMSDYSSPTIGYLIMAKSMNEDLEKNYSERLGNNISFISKKEIEANSELQNMERKIIKDKSAVIQSTDKNNISAYSLYKDQNNNEETVFMLKTEEPRTIYQIGKKNSRYAFYTLVPFFTFLCLSMLIYLNITINKRLELLNLNIQNMSDGKDTSERFAINGNDEITSIAKSFNKLLDKIKR